MDPDNHQTNQSLPSQLQPSSSLNQIQNTHMENENIKNDDEDWKDKHSHENQEEQAIGNKEGEIEEQGKSQNGQECQYEGIEANNEQMQNQQIEGQQNGQNAEHDEEGEEGQQEMDYDSSSSSDNDQIVDEDQRDKDKQQYFPKKTSFVSQESEIHSSESRQKESQGQLKQKISPENKLKQLISSFFTCQNSPFASAPQKVQAILQDAQKEGIFDPSLVDLSSLSFPIKKTPNNFCSVFFTIQEAEHYVCKDCSINKAFQTCICAGCFQPQKHEGHEYVKIKADNFEAFCDCGRPQSLKSQSFCKSHAQCQSKELPDQIETKAQSIMTKQFQITISSLIDCAIYLQNNKELIEKIGDLLIKINQSSVYYNRITFQILNKQSKFRDLSLQPDLKEINTNFYAFALYFQRFIQLTYKLAADLKTNQNIIKVLCHTFDRTHRAVLNRMVSMGKFYLSSLLNIDSLKKLAQSGFTHIFGLHTLHKNIGDFCLKKQALDLKQLIVKQLINKCKNLAELMDLEEYVPRDTSLIYLFKIIEFFPNADTIQKQINVYNLKTGETGPTSVYTLNAVKKVHTSVTKASQHITQVLEYMSNRYMKISQDLRNYVIIHQVSEEKLDTVLSWLITNICHQILFEKYVKIKLIPVLSLMIGSQKQKQHIEHFWRLLLSIHSLQIIQEIIARNKVLSSSQMHHFVNIFFYVVTKVLQSDFHKVCSNIFLTIADPQVEKGKANFSYNVQFLQNWFFSFLYESKYVSREKIIQMKQNGYLQFASASDILNQLCYYNESKKLFCYTCPESFKSIINKFPISALRGDYNSIYANTIHFGYQSNIDQNSVVKKLVDLLFSADNIVPLLDAEWGRYVMSEFVNRNDHYYGYLYILSLVIIDVLNEGVNTELRERLEIIRKEPEAARSFSTKQQEIQLINRLLRTQLSEQVSPKKQQQESQKQISPEKTEIEDENDLQAKKRKAEQKKKKIAQRFKKQNLKILATSQEVIGEKAEQVQVFCILCHQKQKQNNELAYICSVKKNDTSCNALYGKQNKTNTFILSCMHVVHVNCFSQIEKSQQFQFKCPLCKKNSNCILPVSFNKKLARLNTICRNSVVVSIIVSGNGYDVESLFMLILKHLVESKGLNSLISKRDIEQKRKIWAKNDSYLFSYVKFLYEIMSEQQKSKELSKMDTFIQQILTSRINKVREIQLLIATTLKLLITNNQQKFDKQIYLRVRALIIKQEFQTLKLNLESLIGSKIEVPEESPQEAQKQAQKQRVYVRTFALPLCALDTLRLFFDKKCLYSQQHKGQLVCLLCGLSVCYKCLHKHAEEFHNYVSYIFNLVTFKSQYQRKGPAIVIDIYENEFKVSISEGINQGIKYNEFANYFANMDKFGELTEKFLEN